MNIRECVEPLRIEAVERAEKDARTSVERVYADLDKAGWDREAVAPYPWSSMNLSRLDYMNMKRKYDFYSMLTKRVNKNSHGSKRGEAVIVLGNPEAVERYVKTCKEGASAQYTLFIAKLENKIGPHVSATIEGSHVWGHSILTVTKQGRAPGSIDLVEYTERWKTQQIINVSVHGLIFNQWPSRKIK